MIEQSTILQAKNLKKTFSIPNPLTILNGVDLTVHRGETVAIMGRSGEGKSTLLHILGTLEPASEGCLEIAGQPLSRRNTSDIRNTHIGFVFQSFHLLEDYSVLENILMPARIARKSISPSSDSYKRAWKLLSQVGLENRAHYFTKHLSGGEKQRVAIARALCNDPDLILADEPSGNLDAQTAEMIHQLLLNFAHEEGKSLVLVTHDHDLAALCQKQYVLANGKLDLIPKAS